MCDAGGSGSSIEQPEGWTKLTDLLEEAERSPMSPDVEDVEDSSVNHVWPVWPDSEGKWYCGHTDADHAKLEKEMGPEIERCFKRGKERVGGIFLPLFGCFKRGDGNDRPIFLPPFEQFNPPKKYLNGLSPQEKQRIGELDVFRRIYHSKEAAQLRYTAGDCKFGLYEELYEYVMLLAVFMIYREPYKGDVLRWSDMSVMAATYIRNG